MNTAALIYNVNLMPMAEPHRSNMEIWVVILETNQIACIKDSGTLPELSDKYGFETIENNNWDLSSMLKRDCLIKIGNEGYSFVSYTD